MKNVPSNSDNVIDSRDIIKRIEELDDERSDLVTDVEDARKDYEAVDTEADNFDDVEDALTGAETALSDRDDDYAEELKALKSLQDECEGYSDWRRGETLIREDYFTEYAEQLADDLGYMGSGKADHWPFTCIDWEEAAKELLSDYSSVSFGDQEYYIRS